METIPAKSILQRNKSTQWFGTDHTVNLYRGCNHGCIYCDSRSECYGIEEFDRVKAKENALFTLREELRRKQKPCMIGLGSMSDPYNPHEARELLTRGALELMDIYGHGVKVTTKSDLILRDMDILGRIRSHSPVICGLTLTTADQALAKKLEPAAPSPQKRLEALRKLSAAGFFTGVLLMPVLPFLEDNENNIRSLIGQAADAGVKFIYPAFGMTLRDRQRAYYYGKLEELFPGENLRERYRKAFGDQYSCISPQAARLWEVLKAICKPKGILYSMKAIIPASQMGYGDSQMSLF